MYKTIYKTSQFTFEMWPTQAHIQFVLFTSLSGSKSTNALMFTFT